MTWQQVIAGAVLCVAPVAAAALPKTRSANVEETLHGLTVTDPYRWLEDQTSPETRAWIGQQNAYTRSLLDQMPGRERLRTRFRELLRVETVGLPVARGGRYFFTRRQAAQNQAAIVMRVGLDGKDEVLVDPNAMSHDQNTSVDLMAVSQDGQWVAYGTRQGGEDEAVVRILDVERRKDLPDVLPRGRYRVSLKPDKSGFYYSKHLPEGYRVFYHAVGTGVKNDPRIFGEGYGKEYGIDAAVSRDGRYLVLDAATVTHDQIFIQDLEHKGPIRLIVNDLEARFTPRLEGDRMYVLTNWNAPNNRVMLIDLKKPAREKWRDIIPENPQFALESFVLAGGKLVAEYLENVSSHLRIFDPEGKPVREISFPSIGSVMELRGRWDSDELFYDFTSFAQPATGYRHLVSTGRQNTWHKPAVPVDPAAFELKQVWYNSKDGTRVPMFLLHQKGLRPDGERPVLLTGYGGFNVSNTPKFSTQAVAWAESGGVFALPSLRGGGEFGERWHKAGMLANKQNVFDDFIAAAEWLIAERYTRPGRLTIRGGSNGGLLVGAAMVQRPELFQAVACGYPLLDMLRYHKFLLGGLWVPEYGSADDPKQFEYLYRYSPYQHVRDGVKYPAVILITGDSDTRVAPLHARKMAARLQAATASDRPVLLHYDTTAGHSTGVPISKVVEDQTDEIGFLLWQVGTASAQER